MQEIVNASGNKGKIKEAQEILEGFKIISMGEFGIEILLLLLCQMVKKQFVNWEI